MVHCSNCGGIKLANGEVWSGTAANFCQCNKNMQGWECPRCRKIHSPVKMSCDCTEYSCYPAGTAIIGNDLNKNININKPN